MIDKATMKDDPRERFENEEVRTKEPLPNTDDDDNDDDEVEASSVYSQDLEEDVSVHKETPEKIAVQEHKDVLIARLVVFTVLFLAAVGLALLTFFYLRGIEQDAFEDQVAADTEKITEALASAFGSTLSATDAFVVKLVSYARESNNDTWPFVTLPGFGIHAMKLLELSKAFHMSVNVLVASDQKWRWEEYADNNNQWVWDTIRLQNSYDNWDGQSANASTYESTYSIAAARNDSEAEPVTNLGGTNLTDEVLSTFGRGEDIQYYLPSWTQIPIVEDDEGYPYNVDALRLPQGKDILKALEKQNIVMGEFGNVIFDEEDKKGVRRAIGAQRFSAKFLSDDESIEEPTFTLEYPILDSFDSIQVDTSSQHPRVGVVRFTVFLRELLKDILPSTSNDIRLVFNSTCQRNGVFTYSLDGPKTVFLGVGDLHETQYDSLGAEFGFQKLINEDQIRGSSYSGLPLNERHCPKTMSIYPSSETEESFTSIRPIAFSIGAGLIFVFVSAVFVIYDIKVAQRQRVVMRQALASGAIVSELFPATVRKQLYDGVEAKETKENQKNAYAANEDIRESDPKSSKPIAQLFEETSVFFADLAGFTQWSSSKSPTEVFELLEKVYAEFDSLALRRRAEKIETIGDCYLAVTGIPVPMKDHAVAMVKFARDCLIKMEIIKHELAETLGQDTKNLQLRVGIHSGPTTAGVLRGRKARFQLFGDTVNTASRMESNGMPGRIHVSQRTADALTEAGKAHWLTAREEKIQAKGKGEMQTYWVQVDSSGSNSRSSSTHKSGSISSMTSVLTPDYDDSYSNDI